MILVMSRCRKAIGIQLRCELVVPYFALVYVNTHHTLSKEECQRGNALTPCTVVECMWMMWMANMAQGRSAKGLAPAES